MESRAPPGARPGAAPKAHGSILGLHGAAGNRAVARLLHPSARAVQRNVGWTDASKEGRAWNADERGVGKVRRIPLEGLAEGESAKDRAKTWVWDDRAANKGHFETESTAMASLSPESSDGKAIVLVPEGLDATQKIEVLVFLHGFTESAQTRPFAGWRELDNPAPSTDKLDKPHAEKMKRLRQGLDPSELSKGPADAGAGRRARPGRAAARAERPEAARHRPPPGRAPLAVRQGRRHELRRRPLLRGDRVAPARRGQVA